MSDILPDQLSLILLIVFVCINVLTQQPWLEFFFEKNKITFELNIL